MKFFSALYGIVQITSEPNTKNHDFRNPITFGIKPVIFLDEPTLIKPLLDNLSFIRNKERWYGYFQTSLKRIPEKDFELIRGYLLREKRK